MRDTLYSQQSQAEQEAATACPTASGWPLQRPWTSAPLLERKDGLGTSSCLLVPQSTAGEDAAQQQ